MYGVDFILMDSDILLKKDISDLWDENEICVGGKETSWRGTYRVEPFVCYLNVTKMRERGINYFDAAYMNGTQAENGEYHDTYDTGANLYRQVHDIYKRIDSSEYIVHYGAASWWKDSGKPTVEQFVMNNRELWDNKIGLNKYIPYMSLSHACEIVRKKNRNCSA